MSPDGPLNEELCESLRRKCRENAWLKSAADDEANDDGHGRLALEVGFAVSLEEAESFLSAAGHSVGDAVIWEDIAFVQQVDNGDEWWVLKLDAGDRWQQCESISVGPMLEAGALDSYLASLRMRQARATEAAALSERSAAAKAHVAGPSQPRPACDRAPGR